MLDEVFVFGQYDSCTMAYRPSIGNLGSEDSLTPLSFITTSDSCCTRSDLIASNPWPNTA